MNILVVCAAGMSSSALVEKMRKEAALRKYEDMKIGACASMEVHTYALQADVILFAPQLSFMAEQFAGSPHTRVMVLGRQEYGLQDTDSIFRRILEPDTAVHPEEEHKLALKAKKAASTIENNSVVRMLTRGLSALIPVSVIGSLFSLLNNLPIPGYSEMIASGVIGDLLRLGFDMTLGCISLYLCITVAAAGGRDQKNPDYGPSLAALVCFLALAVQPAEGKIDMRYFGIRGMFTAMLTAVLIGSLFRFLESRIRYGSSLDSVPEGVSRSFRSLIPMLVCVLCSVSAAALIRLCGFESLPAMIEQFFVNRLIERVGSSVWSYLLITELSVCLWFFGIHGGHICGLITDPVYLSLSLANIAALQAGQPVPNLVNQGLASVFCFGGVGSTLSLAFLCAFFAKSEKVKTVGKISLPMGIFFINEPLLFGLPVIMNPLMLMPFLAVPLVSAVLSVAAMKAGIIPYAAGYMIPWTTPPIISGMIQGGWRLALWQLLLILGQGFMWYPFFLRMDRQEEEREKDVSE